MGWVSKVVLFRGWLGTSLPVGGSDFLCFAFLFMFFIFSSFFHLLNWHCLDLQVFLLLFFLFCPPVLLGKEQMALWVLGFWHGS